MAGEQLVTLVSSSLILLSLIRFTLIDNFPFISALSPQHRRKLTVMTNTSLDIVNIKPVLFLSQNKHVSSLKVSR